MIETNIVFEVLPKKCPVVERTINLYTKAFNNKMYFAGDTYRSNLVLQL